MKRSLPYLLVIFLFFAASLSGAEAGKIGPGLARLVSSLPDDDPISMRFHRMLKEISETNPSEKMVSAIDLGDKEIARFISLPEPTSSYSPGVSPYRERPHLAIFQYNPERMRIVDFLEEEQHWEQIKKGLHLRDWGNHPLLRQYPEHGHILILEDLAKRTVLEKYGHEMSWDLKEELKGDIDLVWNGTYGVTQAGPAPSSRVSATGPCYAAVRKLAR